VADLLGTEGEGSEAVRAELLAWREARRVGKLEVGHFGAVRGSNVYRDLDAVCLLGEPWPDVCAASEDARALGLPPGPYARALAAAEVEQALGRAREVRRSGARPALLMAS
jgi:hypothetical protein